MILRSKKTLFRMKNRINLLSQNNLFQLKALRIAVKGPKSMLKSYLGEPEIDQGHLSRVPVIVVTISRVLCLPQVRREKEIALIVRGEIQT